MSIDPLIPTPIAFAVLILSVAVLIACLAVKKLRNKSYILRAIMFVLVGLILIRPLIPNGTSVKEMNNLTLFFAADATGSMAASGTRDGKLRRYEQVRADIENVAKKFPGSRYAMVVEDNSIYTALPVTTNLDSIAAAALNIHPKDKLSSSGTSLPDLINYAGEKIQAYKKRNPDAVVILFVMSDGEDTVSSANSIVRSIKNNIAGGAVFGYGTTRGATVPYITYNYKRTNPDVSIGYKYLDYDDDNCVTESFGGCHVSRIDEDNLEEIAKTLGINYYNRNDGGNIPTAVINKIEDEIVYTAAETTESSIDTYWVIALAILVLLMIDFKDIFNRVLQEREVKNARA